MTTDTTEPSTKLPLWRRRKVRITALIVAIPVLAFAWWLGSPLFLNKTVVEAFPGAESPAAVVAQADSDEAADGSDDDTADATTDAAAAVPAALATGDFAGADAFHQGSGTASVFTLEDGSNILRFENLDVTNGPDLHVILTNVANPESREDVMSDGYVDLGSLKGNRGDQNYEIPADFDVTGDISVIIYCEPFHVIFATATLAP